jgi:hypothetical protein
VPALSAVVASTRLNFLFIFLSGDYYISRVRAEPAFAALRSRTRTTHWWPPSVSVPPQEGQVRAQEFPHNTEGLPLFTFAEEPNTFSFFLSLGAYL